MKHVSIQNLVLFGIVGYIGYSANVHTTFVSHLNRIVGVVQRHQIDNLATKVENLEERERLVEQEITQNQLARETVGLTEASQFDRRINHLSAVMSSVRAQKGELIQAIDGLDEQPKKSSAFRSERLGYLDSNSALFVIDATETPRGKTVYEIDRPKSQVDKNMPNTHRTFSAKNCANRMVTVYRLPHVRYSGGCTK